jgi:hypothetical protein
MSVSCEYRVLLGRGLCYVPIPLPEDSYPVWCVWVRLGATKTSAPTVSRKKRSDYEEEVRLWKRGQTVKKRSEYEEEVRLWRRGQTMKKRSEYEEEVRLWRRGQNMTKRSDYEEEVRLWKRGQTMKKRSEYEEDVRLWRRGQTMKKRSEYEEEVRIWRRGQNTKKEINSIVYSKLIFQKTSLICKVTGAATRWQNTWKTNIKTF